MDPTDQFKDWFKKETDVTTSALPSACCLSSIGIDGYPNARFVSLKEVRDGLFIVTGSIVSRKGKEITKNPKVALTFWWPSTEKQVRVQGTTSIIDASRAEQYFQDRSHDSRIVSQISRQGEVLEDPEALQELFLEKKKEKDKLIERPGHWLGFAIHPYRIEFLTFQKSRLHHRELFIQQNDRWTNKLLQP